MIYLRNYPLKRRIHNQDMTIAVRPIAEKKIFAPPALEPPEHDFNVVTSFVSSLAISQSFLTLQYKVKNLFLLSAISEAISNIASASYAGKSCVPRVITDL